MARDLYLLDITDFRPLNSREPKRFLDWITRSFRPLTSGTTPSSEANESSALQAGTTSNSHGGIQLIGAWYAVGITGHEQFRAFSLYRCRGGWTGGWRDMMKLYEGVPDSMFLSAIDGVRFSAKSLPLAAVPGCPTLDGNQQDSLAGPFAMLELVNVSPNAQLDYLSAVREYKAPLLQSYGYRLAGLYEVLFSNTRTAVLWTLDLDAQISMMQARDTARGLDDRGNIDDRILNWDKVAATFQKGEANELYLAGFPGPPLTGTNDMS